MTLIHSKRRVHLRCLPRRDCELIRSDTCLFISCFIFHPSLSALVILDTEMIGAPCLRKFSHLFQSYLPALFNNAPYSPAFRLNHLSPILSRPQTDTPSRLSLENITSTYVPLSLSLLSAVSARVNTTGHLQQVVNPLDWSVAGRDSPEGQAFVLMAYSAWGEWDWRGRDGSRDGSDGLGRVTGGEGRAVGMGLGLGWGLGLGLGAVGLGLGMLI